MPRYLADFLGGLPGFRPTDNRTEHVTKSGYFSGLGGSNTVDPTNLLDPDPTFYNDAGAYGGETVADLRFGGSALGGVGQPYRNTVPRGVAQLAGVGAPLQAREPPAGGAMPPLEPTQRVAPLPMAPDVPMAAPGMPAPRRLPSAGPTMPQAGGAGQVSGPAGASPPARPNFLSAPQGGGGGRDFLRSAGRWLNDPIMNQEPGSGGTSRFMALGQILSGIGAGMAKGGLSGGIQGLGSTVADIRQGEQGRVENEEERQYRRLEMDLKQKKLEQEAAPQTHTLSAGGMLVGPNGEVLARADTAQKAPTSIEQALLDPRPEIRARAEELRDAAAAIKGTPTEYQQQDLALRREKLKAEIAKANRPAADRTVGTSEYERIRDRMPPDQRGKLDRERLKALTTKGESAPFSAGELSGARKDYRAIQKARSDIQRYADLYEKHGNQILPGEVKGEMEAAYGGGLSALAAANNTGVIQPGELPMLQSQLKGPSDWGAEVGQLLGVDTAGQVRGQAAAMFDRLRKAEDELVGTYGADTLTGARRGSGGETAPPPGTPKPGDIVTDQETDESYRFKGGDPADKGNWEKVP